MQQILNYTTKVERIHHLYQEQGEINKLLIDEDLNEFTEKLREKITNADESSVENKVKEKEESTSNQEEPFEKKKKEPEEEKEIKIIEEPESNIDIKV